MKYLFLDIDGVLNHEAWYEYRYSEAKAGRVLERPYDLFDPACVSKVNEILEDTDSRLVVSSSWRLDSDLYKTFKKVGLPTDFDTTPWNMGDGCRGDEIQMFLDKHPCDNYVIVDDDDDMLDSQREHFVRTCDSYADHDRMIENGGTGLTEKLKTDVLKIFNNGR